MELKLKDKGENNLEILLKEIEKTPIVEKITFYGTTIKTYPEVEIKKAKDYLNLITSFKAYLNEIAKKCSCKIELDSLIYNPYLLYKELKSELKKSNCKCEDYRLAIKELIKRMEKLDLYKQHFELIPFERSKLSSTMFSNFKAKRLFSYDLEDGSSVVVYKEGIENYYYLIPSEFSLSEMEERLVKSIINKIEENINLLEEENPKEIVENMVRRYLVENLEELIGNPNEGKDKGGEEEKNEEEKFVITPELTKKLIHIITRNTVGYGVIDILLLDEKIQDIYVNRGEESIYIYHNDFEEMKTNIFPTTSNIEEWVTKIKLENNKPLDETHPVLDGNISHRKSMVRVALVHPPLNTEGISIAIRKHREVPITLPFLVKSGTLPLEAAAYLSIVSLFGISMLIAGGRGSGKTTLLGALLFELPSKYRILVIEDTLELPLSTLIKNNYNVVSLKSKSFLSISEYYIEAKDALKASLRLGDSCLILGEARGEETLALYEAMRVGALSNFVGGTIHAESPYGVYDRVTNDLGVKKTSFKATDVIVMLSLLKTPSTERRERKLIGITELKKEWQEDPLKEKAFLEIIGYSRGKYQYKLEKSRVLEKIASHMPSRFSKKDLIKMIKEKEKQIKYIIELSKKDPTALSPEKVIKYNSIFISKLEEKKPFEEFKKELKEKMH